MAAPSLASLPASLKPIQHYLKTASDHDKKDPFISYYCRLYAMQRGMDIDKKSPEARSYLVGLMDYLEKFKEAYKDEETIHTNIVGKAHVENYALKMFLFADNKDRAGDFSKTVVKSFYTAGMLFDVLTTFEELDEELDKTRRYAKWKAAYIHKCVKNGETPIAGPLPEEGDDAAGAGLIPNMGINNLPNPSMPTVPSPSSSNMASSSDSASLFPTAGAHAPPSTPQDPPNYSSYQQPVPHRSPQPSPRTQPPPQPMNHQPTTDWTPPPNPSGVKITAEQYQKGIKYCKFASSAMQYEDSQTAIENLTKALRLLTTGQDS